MAISGYSVFRAFSTLANRVVCPCGAVLPDRKEIVQSFIERDFRQITRSSVCRRLNSRQFTEYKSCALISSAQEIVTPLIKRFSDVIHVGSSQLVLLEALGEIPQGNFGDMTGDYGKPLAKFLTASSKKGLVPNIGALIDVGGQNTLTVDRVSRALGNRNLPSLIVDINALTPALSKKRENIKYAIDDAHAFFSLGNYHEIVKGVVNADPTLLIFNNLLSVLKAQHGWETLEAAWKRLRCGDYLVVSGIVPEQLERHKFLKGDEVSGILEFQQVGGKFYKSALLPHFSQGVMARLKGSSVLVEEDFTSYAMSSPTRVIEMFGKRLLAVQKN